MGKDEYQEALKMGRREYKAAIAVGSFPYLPVLDQILENEDILTEQYLGLVQVPLDKVVGTSTRGRTQAFARNFMPILDVNSEFSLKWGNLSDAQVTEGIRDPIIAYEYMNRYYVVEGNKRVSVLKYYEAFSIPAIVTRKIPKKSDDEAILRYYDFMKFSDLTGLYTIEFAKEGSVDLLIDAIGTKKKWEDLDRELFNKVLFHFQRAFDFHGGYRLPIKMGDALACFLGIYGFCEALDMTDSEYNQNVQKIWNEFVMLTAKHQVGLVLDPKDTAHVEKKSLWSYLVPSTSKKLTVAFLYTKEPDSSDWIYGHELGRSYLEETFPEQVETIAISGVNDKNIEEILEDTITNKHADIIFGVSPQMMKSSLKAAIAHPEVKILNCSLNTPHRYIRTYYARMYEAKFISGIVAGAMADNNRIAYIADYPIYGMTANINAFALGAKCVNPRAKIYLDWSTRKDYDQDKFLNDNDIQVVSNQDYITPGSESREFGLYLREGDRNLNLAMPLWNWGIFYEKLIQSILAGNYQDEESIKATNYWWGMSAGVVDILTSNKNVPAGVRRIVEYMRKEINEGNVVPFHGEIYDQKGNKRNGENDKLKPEEIMGMDWLLDNIVGTIPTIEELVDDAHAVVELKGVE